MVARLVAPRLPDTIERLGQLDNKTQLQELPRAPGAAPRLHVRHDGARPCQDVRRLGVRRRRAARAGDRAFEEGRRTARGVRCLRPVRLTGNAAAMPELPEVETVRQGLERHVAGRRIVRVEVGRERVVRRTSREALIDGLTDAVVLAADRRGKYLLLPLDTGDSVMIHLRMSGQVLLAAGGRRAPRTHARRPDARRPPGTVVRRPPHIRRDGGVRSRPRGRSRCRNWHCSGIDPIAERFERRDLARIVRSTRRALKPLLLDQHAIAGIGNIYADEILHAARLRPDREASSLDGRAITRLHDVHRRRAAVGHRRRWIDVGRCAVRRPDGVGRVVPGRPPRLRPHR